MNMEKKQLPLIERWELDIRAYKEGAKVKTATPQCKKCKYFVKGDAVHCDAYKDVRKPKDVMFCHKECPSYKSDMILNLAIRNDSENKMYGGLFGFCIGDALGVPVEFSTREERKQDPVKEMRAYGTYHQPFGTWSDDTSLTICLIDALDKGYSIKKVAENFINFYEKSYFTPHGEVFDVGNSTRTAIVRMHNGENPIDCGGILDTDNGNGALMRILPIAFYGQQLNDNELIKMIEEISSLTHRHKRSKLACIFYVEFAVQIIRGYGKEEALDRTINFIKKNCLEIYSDELNNFEKILTKKIIRVSEDEIKSTGYVIDTLEAVLWTFFHADGYREAVLKAINLGGDTDTIAAITGGITGIYYGLKDIPESWLQSLARKEELYQIFEQFYNSFS